MLIVQDNKPVDRGIYKELFSEALTFSLSCFEANIYCANILFFFLSKKARNLIKFPAEGSHNTEQIKNLSRSFKVKYLLCKNTTENGNTAVAQW